MEKHIGAQLEETGIIHQESARRLVTFTHSPPAVPLSGCIKLTMLTKQEGTQLCEVGEREI